MSPKQSSRKFSSVLGGLRDLFGRPQSSLSLTRRSIASRALGFESLEARMLLTASPGASILGTAFNDMSGGGQMVSGDPVLSGITINLFRDGGNGTYQGTALGSDDTLVGTQQTTASGKYEFDNLAAGTYFIQEVVPAGYVLEPGISPVATAVVTNADTNGAAGLTIDSFATSQSVDASSMSVTTSASSVAAPEAIGGNRDLFAQLISAFGDVNLIVNAYNQHLLEYNSSATGTGNRTITWDGPNSATPQTLNPTGLNHVDLTNGGTSTGISTSIGADHNTGTITFRVYKDANDWSTATLSIPNTGGAATQSVFIPFTSFTTGGGTGAGNFTDVGAIQLQIGGNAAVNGQVTLVNTEGPSLHFANLANYQPASVGDLAFWDLNKSGIQTPADSGAANVGVQLLQNGQVVATTTTSAQGFYQFTGLAPGSYSEKFLPSNGSVFTLQHQGTNPALDSDANPTTGATQVFALTSGESNTTIDAGLLPIDLSLAKTVNNPTPTVGSNVTFTITLNNAAGYSPATGVTVSDPLPAGLTFVSATPAAGTSYNSSTGVWTVGSLSSGASTTLTITATVVTGGTTTNTATVRASDEPDVGTVLQGSASVTPPGSIGDYAFWDMNKTGIQAPSDPPADDVTVDLLQNGSVIATTTTSSQGAYLFSNVTPGSYSVKFVPPNNAAFTLQDQGTNPALDSDVNPATGITPVFALASGQNDMNHDAGLLPIDLSLTKTVNNPTPTVGSNVMFTITLNNAAGYSPATGVTVNDPLPAGLTFVSATPAPGTSYNSGTGVWTVGNLASGASTTLTITATVATGGTKTYSAHVTAGDEPDVGTVLQGSASVTPPGSIGDFVFWDLNKTGIQTPSDPGVANVTVELLQNSSIIATTTTNSQGLYAFNGVAPGSYSVKFLPTDGSIFTLQHQGADPALDSDADATGTTQVFALASGQSNTTIDAGLLPIDLSLTKTVNNPTPTVGSNVTFTITANNGAGYSPATGVTVNDPLPAGLTFVSATPASGTSYNSGTGVWTVGNLASGASTTLTITATVATGGTKTNTAQVTASDEPDVGTVLQGSASVTPPGSIGDFVFWDMNKSGIQTPSDTGVSNVAVELLQNGSIIGTTTTNSQGFYAFNGVAPGSYSVKFLPTDGSIFTSQHQGADPALDSDADATGTTQVFALASGQSNTTIDAGLLPIDLSLAKTVNNSTPALGSNVTFTITVSNAAGYSPATGVTASDVLPAGLTLVSATASAGTSYNSATGLWSIGNLASGATANLKITATASVVGTTTNTAHVTAADEPDIGTVLQGSASVTPVLPPPIETPPSVIDLSLTKTVDNPTPTVGTNVTFTITLSNAVGFATATGVTVNDLLPIGLTFVSATPAAGTTYNSGTGLWNVGTLASGASTTLLITARVTTPGVKTNVVDVTGADEEDLDPNPEASAVVTPKMGLSKAFFLGGR